jgi:hypothetical protein
MLTINPAKMISLNDLKLFSERDLSKENTFLNPRRSIVAACIFFCDKLSPDKISVRDYLLEQIAGSGEVSSVETLLLLEFVNLCKFDDGLPDDVKSFVLDALEHEFSRGSASMIIDKYRITY